MPLRRVPECTTAGHGRPDAVYARRMETVAIPTESGPVSASVHGEGDTVIALGHGAGGDRRAGLLVRLAGALAGGGRRVVLYNFPYTEARRRVPDKPAVLEATVTAVAQHAREALGASALVLGGKSMGGRIASQAVAQGLRAEGLVFLGYPLHAPGRFDALRDGHLPQGRGADALHPGDAGRVRAPGPAGRRPGRARRSRHAPFHRERRSLVGGAPPSRARAGTGRSGSRLCHRGLARGTGPVSRNLRVIIPPPSSGWGGEGGRGLVARSPSG